MRKVMLTLSLLALAGLYACNGQTEELKQEVNEALAKVQSLEKELHTKEVELDDLVNKNLKLNENLREVEATKEMGALELTDLEWDEKDEDFKLILRGTVKNIGRVYLSDVTVKVEIRDKTENIIVVPIVNDPDREKMPMLFFHNAADALAQDGSKKFELAIYTRNIHASGLGKVKETIRQPRGENTWLVTPLFVSAQ